MYLVFCIKLDDQKVECIPKGVRGFIRCIATPSPVCSYIFPSTDITRLVLSLVDHPVRRHQDKLFLLQKEVPILFNLVKDLGDEKLPECFRDLLSYLVRRANSPFTDMITDIPPSSNDKMLAWYDLFIQLGLFDPSCGI